MTLSGTSTQLRYWVVRRGERNKENVSTIELSLNTYDSTYSGAVSMLHFIAFYCICCIRDQF